MTGCRRLARATALALALTGGNAGAVACTVSGQSIAFGSYDTFSSLPLDSTGSITVTCDVETAYTLAVSTGAGSYAERAMTSGSHLLLYNLYVDAARGTVWGDGSSGTSTVAGSASAATHTIYGRIPARQNAHVGAYSDAVIVTVNY